MKHFRDSDDYSLSPEDLHEPTVKHFKDDKPYTGNVVTDHINPLKKKIDTLTTQRDLLRKALARQLCRGTGCYMTGACDADYNCGSDECIELHMKEEGK